MTCVHRCKRDALPSPPATLLPFKVMDVLHCSIIKWHHDYRSDCSHDMLSDLDSDTAREAALVYKIVAGDL